MSVYRVEVDDPGCPTCQHDQNFHVIGPDEVALSTSYGDREDAEALADALDAAYQLGRQSVLSDPWAPFLPGSMPPEVGGVSVLVWDAEFNSVSSIYYSAETYTPEYLAKMKYTHWMRSSAVVGPRQVPKTEQPPSPEPPTVQAAPVLEAPPRARDWDDDTPF